MKKITRNLIVLASILLPLEVHAQGNFYFSLGLGSSQFDLNKSNLIGSYAALSDTSSFSDSATSFNFAGGMDLDEFLALEFELVSAGDITAREGNQTLKLFDVSAFAITLATSHQLGEKIALFGRLGVNFWDISESFGQANSINNAVDLTYGLGLDINIYGDRSRQLRLQWNHYEYDGVFIHSSDIISVNLLFKIDY